MNKVSIDLERSYRKIEMELNSYRFFTSMGLFAQKLIRSRVQLKGMGVSQLGLDPSITRERPLKPLSEEYKKKRGPIIAKLRGSQDGSLARVNKSNLTLSGQLMSSISIKASPRGVTLFIDSKSRSESPLRNSDLGEFVQKERPFFALTDKEWEKIMKFVDNEMNRLIRRYL